MSSHLEIDPWKIEEKMEELVYSNTTLLSHHHRLLEMVTFSWYEDQECIHPSEARGWGIEDQRVIYSILRSKGVSLSQGLDIAEVTIQQSKKLNLPVSLILAVMRKESTFTPFALSSQNAMGLMQIHPVTWEWFVNKLNLKLSVYAAFDPATNIIMATHILKDLYIYYQKTSKSESETWKSALSAYYAGWIPFPDKHHQIPYPVCSGCE